MAVGVETVAKKYLDVVADTPISGIPIPAYATDEVYVLYGNDALVAVEGVDYLIDLEPNDFDTVTVTPLASLIAKIDALIAADGTETNFIVVRRILDYTTSATPPLTRKTEFTSREFDRTAMRFQQLEEKTNRAVLLSERIVGDTPKIELDDITADKVLAFNNDASKIVASSLSIAEFEDFVGDAAASALSAQSSATNAGNAALTAVNARNAAVDAEDAAQEAAAVAEAAAGRAQPYLTRLMATMAASAGDFDDVADGTVVSWITSGKVLSVKKSTGATEIPGLADFVPVEPVMAEHYGAAGDGTTNDSSALNALFARNGVVHLRQGAIYVGASVSVTSDNLTIEGHGATIKAAAGATTLPIILRITNRANIKILDVNFDGNEANLTSFNSVVRTDNSTDITFYRCKWTDCLGIASIDVNMSERVHHIECSFTDCGIRNRTTMVSTDRQQAIAFTGTCVECDVIETYFENIGLDCISFATNSTDCRAINNRIRSNDAGSIYITGLRCVAHGNDISNGPNGGNGIDCYLATDAKISDNNCHGCGAAGILIAGCSNTLADANTCKNNYQGGTSTHRGGITLSAPDGEACHNITLTGNVVYDDQGPGSVTQKYAIGIVQTGSGTFSKINIDPSNQLIGYDSSGNESLVSVFQSSLLGLVGYNYSFNLDDGAEVVLYTASGRRGTFYVHVVNNSHVGMFAMRDDNAPIEMIDVSGAFELTDTGSTAAIYRDAGTNEIRLKNNYGSTRTVCIEGGAPVM